MPGLLQLLLSVGGGIRVLLLRCRSRWVSVPDVRDMADVALGDGSVSVMSLAALVGCVRGRRVLLVDACYDLDFGVGRAELLLYQGMVLE